jgi:hypothetical protein
MWTPWHFPRDVAQLETNQVAYTDGVGVLDTPQDIITTTSVRGNAAAHGGLLTREANSLVFRNYGFALGAGTVQAVEIQLSVTRLSRIQDRTVQLYWNEPIGANLADLAAGDVHVYASPALVGVDYAHPNFGCVIDLGPHQSYPSNNTIVIHSVAMRLDLV